MVDGIAQAPNGDGGNHIAPSPTSAKPNREEHTMSEFKNFAIEICDAMESVTGDDPDAMLEWLDGYDSEMPDAVCTLLEGDSDVQDGPVMPMYERTADGATRLNPEFRKRLASVLNVMTCCSCLGWCVDTANAASADPQSVVDALLKAYAYAE